MARKKRMTGRVCSPVERHMHDDPVYRAENLHTRYLWGYLLTTARRPKSIEGLIVASFVEIAGDLNFGETTGDGIPGGLDLVRKSFSRLEEIGWVRSDLDARIILLPTVIRSRPPVNPNIVRSWGNQLRDIPISPLVREWLRIAHEVVCLLGNQWHKAFEETLGNPPKGGSE